MSKRQSILTGALILTFLLLLVPSFRARVIVGLLVLAAVVVWLAIEGRRQKPSSSTKDKIHQTVTDNETFARSALFEATMGGMREGLLVVDRDMHVVVCNPAAEKLFTSVKGDIHSQRITELTRNPSIYSAFLDGLKGIPRSGVKVDIHGANRQVFDLSVLPLGPSNGAGAEGALGVFFDVTRTERLETVRQEFLSNVSHELRTPLTAIMAFVETLENGALDDAESSRRFLEIIRKNASRMHALIDDILELTAIEGGNVQLRAAPVDLHVVTNEVIASLAAKSSASGVTVTNEVPLGIFVHADLRRLEQMLTNLVDNGIKFGREDGHVTIKYEDGIRDQIIVADNGEGIPAQHLERLFERFYRVDRARSRDLGGTGLGLAILKHLALLHGGEVTVESELGKGTKFTIHLPKGPSNEAKP